MKEILRIKDGSQDDLKDNILRNYNLEVYAGEIVYIQGLPGNGIKTLIDVLAGDRELKQGEIYIHEELVHDYHWNTAHKYQIYGITAERDLVNHLTVAENMEAVRYIPKVGSIYRSKNVDKKITEYLKSEEVDIPVQLPLWMLNIEEKQKLSILKAKMHGADLIILDATTDIYEGKMAEDLCRMIHRLNREGTAFVILSECYTAFAEIAARIQVMHCGMDLKEWTTLTETVRQRLRNQTDLFSGYARIAANRHQYDFIGMYDYEWETRKSIWKYLSYVKENNEDIWEKYIGATLPAEGASFNQSTVVIPKESAEFLLTNLSIEDNIIITIPERISGSKLGVIRKRLQKNIADDFYKITGTNRQYENISRLSRVHRKILSIFRWEAERPQTIFLESPYGGMNQEEIACLRKYLERLSKKRILIIYFAKSMEEMKDDCSLIITTQNGKCAKINTISQNFPPPCKYKDCYDDYIKKLTE